MRFRLERTSAHAGDPEVAEAVEGTYTQHIYCTLPLKQALVSERTDWFRKLENQRSAPGGSVGDRPNVHAWFIDLPDLEAVMAFAEKHGAIIINQQSDGPVLEIYDDYRE